MILTELKSYLLENKRVHLIDLARHFEVTPEALSGMLEHWIRKGKVRRLVGSVCGKQCCCQTNPANLEIYEWIA